MSEQYDNRGSVALWKPTTDNPKAPAAKGTVVAHRDIREGEEVEIALWRFQSDNPNAPLMKGKISDKRQQQAPQGETYSSGGRREPAGGGFDDTSDIPF